MQNDSNPDDLVELIAELNSEGTSLEREGRAAKAITRLRERIAELEGDVMVRASEVQSLALDIKTLKFALDKERERIAELEAERGSEIGGITAAVGPLGQFGIEQRDRAEHAEAELAKLEGMK